MSPLRMRREGFPPRLATGSARPLAKAGHPDPGCPDAGGGDGAGHGPVHGPARAAVPAAAVRPLGGHAEPAVEQAAPVGARRPAPPPRAERAGAGPALASGGVRVWFRQDRSLDPASGREVDPARRSGGAPRFSATGGRALADGALARAGRPPSGGKPCHRHLGSILERSGQRSPGAGHDHHLRLADLDHRGRPAARLRRRRRGFLGAEHRAARPGRPRCPQPDRRAGRPARRRDPRAGQRRPGPPRSCRPGHPSGAVRTTRAPAGRSGAKGPPGPAHGRALLADARGGGAGAVLLLCERLQPPAGAGLRPAARAGAPVLDGRHPHEARTPDVDRGVADRAGRRLARRRPRCLRRPSRQRPGRS